MDVNNIAIGRRLEEKVVSQINSVNKLTAKVSPAVQVEDGHIGPRRAFNYLTDHIVGHCVQSRSRRVSCCESDIFIKPGFGKQNPVEQGIIDKFEQKLPISIRHNKV